MMDIDWEKLSKEDLDYHLSPSQWSKRLGVNEAVEHFVSTISAGSDATRKCTVHNSDIPYGENSEMQKIDLYLPEHQTEESPVLIFIHGGYWQACCKDQHGLVAMHPTKKGAVVALVGYTLAPVGTLQQMMDEVEQACVYLARLFPKSRGFFLSGHSAGGQLAAMMLTVDWPAKYGLPRELIKGVCPLSGIFDVRPIRLSYVNDPLKLTQEDAYQASPITQHNLSEVIRLATHCRIINVCGEEDPPLLSQMTRKYTKELTNGGLNATCEVIPHMDHFELVERLVEEDHCITKILLNLMSL